MHDFQMVTILSTIQHACIQLGNHQHPVKVNNYKHSRRDSRKSIDALIEEHVEQMPQATQQNRF